MVAAMPIHREIRVGADPASIFHLQMQWTIVNADCEGTWSFKVVRQWSDDEWRSAYEPKLNEWAKLKWSEIDSFTTGGRERHKMHHSMPVEIICDEAQLRLMGLDQSEETIFRFRLGNLPRPWGFRRAAVFHVLWHDPTHQIYPTDHA